MAVGKRRRVKLEIDPHAGLDVNPSNIDRIKYPSMASDPQSKPPSPMGPASASGPIASPLDYTRLGPLPSLQPMSRASASLTAARRRRMSKGSMSQSSLKRSASTPDVRGLVAADTTMSSADKRRNKLGYHRTSVACGHCRRRKIRCLLALDDPQNRCSNCIKLKKECCFFPVDQQPQMDRRPRTSSKAGSGELSMSSSSSSPALAGGPVMEQFNQFHQMPLQTQDYPPPAASLSTTTSSPSRRASETSRTYEFSYHPERSHWESPFYDHGPPTSAGRSTPDDPSNPYWRIGESPMTPAFPQYPGPSNALAQHAYEPRSSFAAFNSPREDHGWPVAPRSMSFGHVEDLSHGYPNPYHSPMSMDYRRRPSELYPPSLQTSSATSSKHNSNGEVSTPPLAAAAAATSQPMTDFVAPAWNSLPGSSVMSKAPEYSTWYSEPAPLAKVQEEEVSHPYGGGQGAIFTSVG